MSGQRLFGTTICAQLPLSVYSSAAEMGKMAAPTIITGIMQIHKFAEYDSIDTIVSRDVLLKKTQQFIIRL